MLPLPASSGDLLVDRRLSYAQALADEGDAAAAAALLAETLPRVPGWTAGWLLLGEFHEQAGARGAAAEAYGRALALDPQDRLGAGLRLDLLRQVPVAEAMPSAFVETLFDAYAPEFETALVTRLEYRGPALIAAALPDRRFARALDLGCGTGLMAPPLRPRCDHLEGWDISAGMLREASSKGLYDRLARADLQRLERPEAPEWDLIVAADVFIYLGALERIAGWIAGALRPGGTLAFTVEACVEGFELGPARRYRHAPTYLVDLLGAAGFTDLTLTPAVLRQDRGTPVAGLVVAAALAPPRRESEGEAMADIA